MKSLTSVPLMYLKASLLFVAGFISAALLVLRSPSVVTVLLVSITTWAFCRAYYFAFYVVERYADPTYRFSGLMSFVRYLLRRRPAAREGVV